MTVEAHALGVAYQTRFTAGDHTGLADTRKDNVGGSVGMRPHELLEAALATCMAITARMAMEEFGLAAPAVSVRVRLERSDRATIVRYGVTANPRLDDVRREVLANRLERSPVARTLRAPMVLVTDTTHRDSVGLQTPP